MALKNKMLIGIGLILLGFLNYEFEPKVYKQPVTQEFQQVINEYKANCNQYTTYNNVYYTCNDLRAYLTKRGYK